HRRQRLAVEIGIDERAHAFDRVAILGTTAGDLDRDIGGPRHQIAEDLDHVRRRARELRVRLAPRFGPRRQMRTDPGGGGPLGRLRDRALAADIETPWRAPWAARPWLACASKTGDQWRAWRHLWE